MSDTSKIGARLKKERKARGITIKELAEEIEAESGEEISESTISMWENGKRRIYSDQLYYVCKALRISPMTLFGDGSLASEIDKRLQDEVLMLPKDEKEIFYYLFYKWDGNPRALVKFLGLYMSLPKKLRLDIAGMGVTMYHIGKDANQLDKSAPPVDIKYIDEAWDKLLK